MNVHHSPNDSQSGTVALRAALYLRVSTARQAEHDVSIPDQRKQGELRMRIEDTKIRLKRLYDGVEAGLFDPKEPALAERMAGLRGIHDQALADAGRIEAMLENAGDKAITPATIRKLAASAREKMRLASGGYRREHLRALAQRVEVGEREVHISGSKNELLRALTGADAAKTSMISVPISVPKWRRGWA